MISPLRCHVGLALLACYVVILNGSTIAQSAAGDKPREKSSAFSARPHAEFTQPGVAKIRWKTNIAGKGSLAFGTSRDLGTVLKADASDQNVNEVTLKGLRPHTKYYYRLALDHTPQTKKDSTPQRLFSSTYELDTSFNYGALPVDETTVPESALARAEQILELAGRRTGIFLVADLKDGALLRALAARSQAMVVGVSRDEAKIQELRKEIYAEGLYGTRITLRHVRKDGISPFATATFNLITHENSGSRAADSDHFGSPELFAELLAPGNGKCIQSIEQFESFFASKKEADTPSRLGLKVVRDDATGLVVLTRDQLPGSADWSHQYGTAANKTSTEEQLGSARSVDDLVLQWVGRPGGDFGIDRNPRMPAPLAVNGRLYHQGMERMVALDQYNGTVAWGLEIPDLQRLNIPRDSSNWCADSQRLYLAVKNHAWIVNADAGRVIADVPLPEANRAGHDWSWIAVHDGQLFGSTVPTGRGYSSFWGGEMWFDGKQGAGTYPICSNSLFAYQPPDKPDDDPKLLWEYRRGLVINPTITIDGEFIYFVESPQLTEGGGSVADPALWKDATLVAINRTTGKRVWEKPVTGEPFARGVSSYYLLAHPERILLVASNKKYHIYAFDPKDGELVWNDERKWFDDHHSGHIQRPVIVGDKLYLQPNGFDVISGKHLTSKMGKREGCHTYVGAGSSLIFRGTSRQISMWDPLSEETTTWNRLRPSCWLSVIPAGGMLLIPEGGGGCSCGNWIETSIGLIPKSHLRSPVELSATKRAEK